MSCLSHLSFGFSEEKRKEKKIEKEKVRRKRERQTDRQTDRQTERVRERDVKRDILVIDKWFMATPTRTFKHLRLGFPCLQTIRKEAC